MIIGIVGGILLLLIVFFISVFNELTKERVLVHEAWSGIGAFLQQRLDAIPNLVEIVKGYAGHENKTLTDVIRARNESISALTPEAQVEAAKNLSAAMLNFKALAENYPDLKANQNFLQLQEELSDIENKLAASRRFFNAATAEYNNAVESFPGNLVARNFGFQKEIMFDLGTDTRKQMEEPPKIQF